MGMGGGVNGRREQWTIIDVAAYLGVKRSTVSAYRTRAQMPPPDGYTGRTPWWYPDTIKGWHRPRRGSSGE